MLVESQVELQKESVEAGDTPLRNPQELLGSTVPLAELSLEEFVRVPVRVLIASATAGLGVSHFSAGMVEACGGPCPTSTPKVEKTATSKPTNTPPPTNTPLPTSTPKPTATPEPTDTPIPKPTKTPEATDTPLPTPTKTAAPTASATPTETPGPDATATVGPTPGETPGPTDTPTLTPTAVLAPTPNPTAPPPPEVVPPPESPPAGNGGPGPEATDVPITVPMEFNICQSTDVPNKVISADAFFQLGKDAGIFTGAVETITAEEYFQNVFANLSQAEVNQLKLDLEKAINESRNVCTVESTPTPQIIIPTLPPTLVVIPTIPATATATITVTPFSTPTPFSTATPTATVVPPPIQVPVQIPMASGIENVPMLVAGFMAAGKIWVNRRRF